MQNKCIVGTRKLLGIIENHRITSFEKDARHVLRSLTSPKEHNLGSFSKFQLEIG